MTTRQTPRQEREHRVLIGLIEEFIKTAKPVGSKTLQEAGFGDLSSATIRNYFADLEKQGYLTQQHTSGGRIPTAHAYRYFANTFFENKETSPEVETVLHPLKNKETRAIASYLQDVAEALSDFTHYATFLSAPRFDQDFVADIRLLALDTKRLLCVLITDFGQVLTELMYSDIELNASTVEKLERYFRFRVSGQGKPKKLKPPEEEAAQKLYNETMVRFISGYSSFTEEDSYRTGFSKLIEYPDFFDTAHLSSALSLFESASGTRLMLRECVKREQLKYWIGEDLTPYIATQEINCAVIAIPFYINKQPVGAMGLLGPMRMPYPALFAVMRAFSEGVSEALTRNLYKHKISFRQPQEGSESYLLGKNRLMLLEDKRED